MQALVPIQQVADLLELRVTEASDSPAHLSAV
jgi:hypothetical protein